MNPITHPGTPIHKKSNYKAKNHQLVSGAKKQADLPAGSASGGGFLQPPLVHKKPGDEAKPMLNPSPKPKPKNMGPLINEYYQQPTEGLKRLATPHHEDGVPGSSKDSSNSPKVAKVASSKAADSEGWQPLEAQKKKRDLKVVSKGQERGVQE